jgi:hypothetical protein
LADAGTIQFGNDQDVTLTHVADTGLLLNTASVIQFRDSAINIGSPADGDLDINADDEVEINSTLIDVNGNLDVSGTIVGASTLSATTGTFSGVLKTDDATEATSTTDGSLQTDGGLSVVKDIVAGDDIKLLSDAAVVHFGADSEITLTHSADSGLLLKHTATADDKPINLVLQTGETDMAANDVIGKISWQAPDEGAGTDAILVSAAIQAVAEGDHSASSNATSLQFMTGASEAAAAKMVIASDGDVGIGTTAPTRTFHLHNTSQPYIHMTNNATGQTTSDGFDIIVDSSAGKAILNNRENQPIEFMTNNAVRFAVSADGHILPAADDTYDLGSGSYQWRNVYTGDLHLSNMTKETGNAVDGTKGDWTIQEGADDLFLLNNNSGKKYKFNLTEIQ